MHASIEQTLEFQILYSRLDTYLIPPNWQPMTARTRELLVSSSQMTTVIAKYIAMPPMELFPNEGSEDGDIPSKSLCYARKNKEKKGQKLEGNCWRGRDLKSKKE